MKGALLSKRVPASFLVVFLAVAVPALARQAPAPPPPVPPAAFQVSRATSPVKVDGVLDEDAWAHAAVVPLPFEWAPGDNTPPPVETECLVTFDAASLYLACRASDPDPSAIRAHLMDRDAIDTLIQDDHVGFMIDTYNDKRRAFQFRVNPLGVQADAIFSEMDGVEDWSWDTIWASAGTIGPGGFVVEVAIPFKQIRFPGASEPQTWGFEAFRSYPRNVRHRISSRYTDRSKSCILCQENTLEGFSGIAPGRNIELDPTVTARRTDERDELPSGPMEKGKVIGDVGLTARWGMTSNLVLTGAVNPDFSQVEADVAQLDVNTRFALFYPEKRPFFLEGLDYFTTPFQAVFTRTVADPSAGLKVTGKEGRNAVGVFITRDRVNNLVIPSNESSDMASTSDDVTGTVVRYRRDIGGESTLGALYAGREAGAYFNRVYGADGFFRFSPSDTVQFQFLHSDTEYSQEVAEAHDQPTDVGGGNALVAVYQHVGRSWVWVADYTDLDPAFRGDSGYMPRVDVRTGQAQVQRRFWGSATSWFTRMNVGVRGLVTEDHDGRLTDQTAAAYVNYMGPWQSEAFANIRLDKETYEGVTYSLRRHMFNFAIQPAGAIRLGIDGQVGDDIDFANAQPASLVRLAPFLEWKIRKPLNLQVSHAYERLAVEEGRLYAANLTQLRAVYHFNVHTFVRAILQYTDVARDPALYTSEVASSTRRLFSQYLFSYKLNPRTVLLVGYSDNLAAASRDPLTQTNRTFFVKIGYAWVL